MEDKYILMGLNDEKSKLVAEILKNKTAKKILNHLGDNNEVSEKDISDALHIPINTVEYNLKNLIKAGLVKKSEKFFWSQKGRKIPLYKLAKKHIIISPGNNPSINALKSILPGMIAVLLIGLVIFASIFSLNTNGPDPLDNSGENINLNKFKSQEDLESYLNLKVEQQRGISDLFGGILGQNNIIESNQVGTAGIASDTANAGTSAQKSTDFSTTNIQVEGVDEADIVKNDGKYIYVVSNGNVIILNAFPAENLGIIAEIEINGTASEIFINNDKLIIFSRGNYGYGYPTEAKSNSATGATVEASIINEPVIPSNFRNSVLIYDTSDKSNPVLENEIYYDGNYINSRKIGDIVYVISNKQIRTIKPEPPIFAHNGIEDKTQASNVYYFDQPDFSYSFTTITAIDVDQGVYENAVYLLGTSHTVYVSEDNIYLTQRKSFDISEYANDFAVEVAYPILPSDQDNLITDILNSNQGEYEKISKMNKIINNFALNIKDQNELEEFSAELKNNLEDFNIKIQKKSDRTQIHKINIDGFDIEYIGSGVVPGHILNQFSMDEYNGYFRIATTTGQLSRSGSSSLNHLYVLDKDMEIIGKVEDLASGESIYSARFLGDRAYIVTFKKVDPLFVIDLSQPDSPEVLGYLKITGYSDYLHIYDEDHIIGIGKETGGGNEDFSWYQGVKVSLFDVSDVKNPIEKAKIEIGDRGTDSEALRDHKAVLFDKDKNLLVLPIRLHEVPEPAYNQGALPDNAYGNFVWAGAFVLDISLDGIEEKGRITHERKITNSNNPTQPRYYGYGENIKRSLYMDNVLYTISNFMVKANDLDDLEEIREIQFPNSSNYY